MTLLAISIAPIILILIYIYRRDKYEKEPRKLLIKTFIFGALTVLPIFFIETWLGNYWNNKYNFPSNQMLTAAYNAFIVAASTEEIFKYSVFILVIWKSKDFNEKFDGIVYAAYISLGFAAIENIMYVLQNGAGTGIMRAFTAVPAHTMFGISMGYFLAWAKFRPQKRILYLILSLTVPIVLHGFYDFIIMSQHTVLLLFFIPFLIAMLVMAFKQMKHLSNISRFKPE
ncbi:MAG: PrsW family glutamic-type intramembrane protease [Bacteroidales bacterium]|nr:PrsW family glutamic-type intramembrane protease [Bacteroidales bacterium]